MPLGCSPQAVPWQGQTCATLAPKKQPCALQGLEKMEQPPGEDAESRTRAVGCGVHLLISVLSSCVNNMQIAP